MNDWKDLAEADGNYAIACALLEVARAIDRLGNGNAATPMGAIEAFGMHIGDKIDSLTDVLRGLADE